MSRQIYSCRADSPDMQVRKEPKEIQLEKAAEAKAALAARTAARREKNDEKAKMKGKNKPSRRHRKKQSNIIEERKADVQQHMQEEARERKDSRSKDADDAAAPVPRALQMFYRRAL